MGECLHSPGSTLTGLLTPLRLTTPFSSGLVRYGLLQSENTHMTTEDTSYAVLSAPEMDGMFTATAVTEPELLDQCRALVYAITELTNSTARDCLTWLLMERLEIMREVADA